MAIDRSADESAVVATYSSRHDAEVASDFLQDRGIESSVMADDVHPPLQMTEGARLVAMSKDAERAREALLDADMLPRGEHSTERPQGVAGAGSDGAERGTSVRLTAWAYVAIFALIVIAVIAGLLFV